MKDKVKTVAYKNQEVLILDFSNLKEAAMIEIILVAKERIVKENKKVLVLNIFNQKNYVSPKFMRVLEKEAKDVQHLITKNAVTGISEVQRWIVKGINLWFKNQLHTFDSVEKALDYLVS